jgi:hypothetical protein
MRIPRHWCAVVLLAALCTPPALAQETTGRLEGGVLDAKGQPIADVNVSVSSPSLQGGRGCLTTAKGTFVLLALPVGAYTVKLSHLAYQPREIPEVRIRLGQTTTVGQVRLQEQVYAQSEILVTARAPLVDPRSTVVGENLAARDYEALPVDRDYKNLATLLPHANTSYLGDPVNIAGATGVENRYFVDGIDVTDSFRNSTGTNLPYNFIQEVQVRSGGYQAEYRSSLGGTVNVVTYSGGNEVRGQAFGFYTGNGFSATPRSVPGTASQDRSYAHYDIGFGVGGPIRQDRLWYYAAYNPNFSREDVEIPGWGTFLDHTTAHSFAGKLTWRADGNNTLVLTTVGDPLSGRTVTPPVLRPGNSDPFLFDVRQGGVNVMLEGQHMIGGHLLLKSWVSRAGRNEESTPETELGRTAPFFQDSAGAQSGGGATTRNDSRVTMAGLGCTWLKGNHEVKAGLELRSVRLEFDTHYDILFRNSATEYYFQTAAFKGHVGSRNPSVYLQDAWRATGRLQLNVGLRWDGQYFISSEDKVAQTILDGWQPRVGATYQLGHPGTQKLFTSYGRFYQDYATAPLFWYYNSGSRFFSANYDHDPRLDPSGADTLGLVTGAIQQKVDGLQGQYYDEFTLGFERQIGANSRFVVRGIRRTLGQGLEDGVNLTTGEVGLSNPGRGVLRDFPRMKRNYTALEVSWQGQASRSLMFVGSYVLSRNAGNYEGLFDSRFNNPYVNATGLYDVPDILINAYGPLPNDRTHAFKLSGSYRAAQGLTLGAIGVWESGTPMSELGGTAIGGMYTGYIHPRGSAGRTPSIWDLSLRASYQPEFTTRGSVQPKLTLDVFHVASQRRAVRYDEVHYRALDSSGNQTDLNPNYGMPIAFQPPMAVRLGLEVGF